VRAFFKDRLNAAWIGSGALLAAVVLVTPDHGWGTAARIVAASIAIGLSGATRIRDARRDRARRAARDGDRRRN
jgi:hypothetical protein